MNVRDAVVGFVAVVGLGGAASAQGYNIEIITPNGGSAIGVVTGYAMPVYVLSGEMQTDDGRTFGCVNIYNPVFTRNGSVSSYQKDTRNWGIVDFNKGILYAQPSNNSSNVWQYVNAIYTTNYQNITFQTNMNGEGIFTSNPVRLAVNPQTGSYGPPKGLSTSPGGFCNKRFVDEAWPRQPK